MESNIESLAVAPDQTHAFDFKAVFHDQYPRVVRLISRIVNDSGRSEDIAVEVFLKLWQTAKAHGENVNGWLYRTAIRMSLDGLRRRNRREKYEKFFGLPRAAPTPEQLHSEGQRQQRVRLVLSVMKPRLAELLLLRSDGVSYQELAQILELNPVSIGTLLSRAQKTFRKEYIKRYGPE